MPWPDDDRDGRKRRSGEHIHHHDRRDGNEKKARIYDLSPELRWAFSVKGCAFIIDLGKALNL